ncbi:MAG: penicillin-binding protein [Acidobacteria bacterium]|mgnify:CR=1 FL=1|nr:penicillin-binding protein [Acidobacteriota bacterium]
MATNSHQASRWRHTVRRRVSFAVAVLVLWAIAIEARLVQLQVVRYDEFVERAERQQSRSIETHPKRGEILDREGRVLAYSVEADTVVAVPVDVEEPLETVGLLCEVIGCDGSQIKLLQKRLSQPDRQFAYVRRHVSVNAAQQIRDLDLKGIGLIKEDRRFYPNKELASHLIGYVGIDNQGLHGLESRYDQEMKGRPGRVQIQVDARRRTFSRVERPPTTGASLELTIDKYLQHIAERELRAAVLEHGAAGGSVVVLDPRTGDILALANEPTFNPNDFALSTADVRRNRATQDVYEPGSTFKIVTASAALEERVFRQDEIIDVSPGVIYFGGRPIRDVGSYGALSFADVIVKSSNVGASKIGVKLGPERLGRYVRRFGFGQAFAIDFPGQSRGIVHDPSRITESTLARVAMGYSISVTPLQMAVAMNAVANGGELMAPRLVRGLRSSDSHSEVPGRVIRRAVTQETASMLTRIMEDVVSRGTARNARLAGYTVAGKTGTAEKIVNGRYSETDHVASFVGFVPSTKPALTILVVIDDVARFGGSVAAPAFKRIAEASLRHLAIPPNVDAPPPILAPVVPRLVQQVQVSTPLEPESVSEGFMPDLRGLSARKAVAVATGLGLSSRLKGSGFVADQAPQPGQVIGRGQELTIWLNRTKKAVSELRSKR